MSLTAGVLCVCSQSSGLCTGPRIVTLRCEKTQRQEDTLALSTSKIPSQKCTRYNGWNDGRSKVSLPSLRRRMRVIILIIFFVLFCFVLFCFLFCFVLFVLFVLFFSRAHSVVVMPCSCSAGLCSGCACGKAGLQCGPGCHGSRTGDAEAWLTSNCACMNFAEAKAISDMPLADVRRTLARAGSSVIGNGPELKRRLAEVTATHMC